jgi:hypothetical protein
MTDGFYDELAESYHLIFDDWDVAIPRQRDVLARLLPAPLEGKRVLDCACGIGNQAIGLGMLGFTVRRVRFLCNFDRPRATRSDRTWIAPALRVGNGVNVSTAEIRIVMLASNAGGS